MPRFRAALAAARRLLAAAFLAAATVASPAGAATTVTLANSDATGPLSRFDVDGNALDAHDGSILKVGKLFYLYGTSYACGYRYQANSQFCGFKAYSSPDLVHWTDRGYVLAPGACGYCFRPHVVYNAATAKYVLWADGGGRYIVATNGAPTGLFTPQPDPVLAVGGAVDMALFVDHTGAGYLVHNTTLVAAGLTADMVVEPLTADYLGTTGASVRLGLGDVEAFAVFERDGVYHALMSDPSCAYCAGSTGEMTATSMMGPWSGAWYDPDGVHQSGRAEPRWRARIVGADSCGGQPLAAFPVVDAKGRTSWEFMSDRWNDRAPNESLANFFIGSMSFDTAGVLQPIACVASAKLRMPGPAAGYASSPELDQRSGFDGFHHYCDIAGPVVRQQGFTPSRSGTLSVASVTSFQGGTPTAALVLEVVDGATGSVLSHAEFAAASVSWAPAALAAHPGIAVTAGHAYLLRLRTASTTGCYGWEYADANPYAGGNEAYSVDGGASFTAEPARDLKFSTDVSAQPRYVAPGVPAGWTRCAGEGGSCVLSGTRMVSYGAGSGEGAYRTRLASGTIACGIVAFGGDPDVGVLKSCYAAPDGGPAGFASCAGEGGTCTLSAPAMVAFGANGAFAYKLLPGVAKACHVGGAPAGATACASEGGSCASSGAARTIVYGARGAFYSRWFAGDAACDSASFGADPIFGVAKACYPQ